MIELHILDAARRLRPYRRSLKRGFRVARARVPRLLPVGDVDVVMQELPALTIAETGVGGYSPAADILYIYCNPAHPQFRSSLDRELVPMIAHEMLHCVRWRGPGYGATLGEALVSEGLAMHVESLFRGHAPFYGTTVDDAGLTRMLERARPLFDSTDYGHAAWFIGSEERDIPRYGGYALGYRIVANGLRRLGLHVAAAWDRPARDFLSGV